MTKGSITPYIDVPYRGDNHVTLRTEGEDPFKLFPSDDQWFEYVSRRTGMGDLEVSSIDYCTYCDNRITIARIGVLYI